MRALLCASAVVASISTLALAPRPARADLAGSVYSDVRDVIEELIQAEITTSVVTTIQTRAPLVGAYFRGTLERLASPSWGGLATSLRDDLTAVVGDFVYWHLAYGAAAGDGDVVHSARQFFACATATGSGTDDAGCDRLREVVVKGGRTLIDAECRRVDPPAERRVACDLGLAARAALDGRGAARRHVLDAIADLLLARVGDPVLGRRLREVLIAWLDDPRLAPGLLIDKVIAGDTLKFLGSDQLPALCGNKAAMRAYYENPASVPGWACVAVGGATLPETLRLDVEVSANASGVPAKGKVDFWRLGPLLATIGDDRWGDDALFGALSTAAIDEHCRDATRRGAWPCTDATLPTGATVTVRWLDLELVGKVAASGKIRGDTPKELARWMKRFAKAADEIAALKASMPPALDDLLFVADQGREDGQAILMSVAQMGRLAGALQSRWHLWQADQGLANLDIVALLELAQATLVDGGAQLTGAADVVGRIAGDHARELGDWLRLVVRGDRRALASEVLRAGLDGADEPHETFFVALAAFLLDAPDGAAEDVTRGAFRAAAKDLLLRARSSGVPGSKNRWKLSWLPRVAVRVSINEDHAVVSGDRTRRTVVAADWPTAMVAFGDHVGAELSLLDPLAPLAELALRPPGDYTKESTVALDAVRPRLGVWVALPEVTRRITLGLGVGARLVGVDVESADGEPLEARYVQRASLTIDLGVSMVF